MPDYGDSRKYTGDLTPPTVKDQIDRRADDPQHRAALLEFEEEEQERRRASAVQCFRLGVKRLCARGIWGQVEDCVSEKQDPALATKLKIRRQEPAKLRRGEMSFEVLIALMGELAWNWSDLRPIPLLVNRVVAGYQLLIHWLRSGDKNPDADALIDGESLLVGFAVLADEEVDRARRENKIREIDWDDVASRVVLKVAGLLGRSASEMSIGSRELQRIRRKWNRLLVESRSLVPHRWLPELDA